MVKKERVFNQVSNDGIKLDSCLPSISNNSKYSIKQLRNMSYLDIVLS